MTNKYIVSLASEQGFFPVLFSYVQVSFDISQINQVNIYITPPPGIPAAVLDVEITRYAFL